MQRRSSVTASQTVAADTWADFNLLLITRAVQSQKDTAVAASSSDHPSVSRFNDIQRPCASLTNL